MSYFETEGATATWELDPASEGTEARSGPPVQPPGVAALYVSHANQGTISVHHLQADGRLSEVQRLQVGGMVTQMAVHPDRRTLYAVRGSEQSVVVSLAIDPLSGRLSPVKETSLPASMVGLHICSSGRYLLAASYASQLVAVCDITSDGLPLTPHQIVHNIPKAFGACLRLGLRRAFVSSTNADDMLSYRFDDKRGLLDLNTVQRVRLPLRPGPRQWEWHPRLNVVFVLSESDGQLHVLEMDGAHLRQHQQANSLPAQRNALRQSASLKATPDGRFLFASVRQGGTVSSYRIHPTTGHLNLLSHWPVQHPPHTLLVDSLSRYLMLASPSSHRVGVYAIGDEGTLALLRETELGSSPSGMELVRLPAG
jgi:6-phosphogluconolactonase